MEAAPMTIVDMLNWIWDNLIGLIGIASLFIEISPIKINPIGWIGKKLMQPVKNEITNEINIVKTELKKDIDEIKAQQKTIQNDLNKIVEEMDAQEIRHLRWEILEFGMSIENGQLHTRDQFRHIEDDMKKYHTLIEKYELTNGLIDEVSQKIEKHYNENKDNPARYI